MNKITKKVIWVVICSVVVFLVYAGSPMEKLAISKDIPSEEKVKKSEFNPAIVKLLLEDKDPKSKRPKVALEWDEAWGGLWSNEAQELKAQGLSEEKIIEQLNPEAARRVAKKLKVKNPEDVQQAINEYFSASALKESKDKPKSKSQSR